MSCLTYLELRQFQIMKESVAKCQQKNKVDKCLNCDEFTVCGYTFKEMI